MTILDFQSAFLANPPVLLQYLEVHAKFSSTTVITAV